MTIFKAIIDAPINSVCNKPTVNSKQSHLFIETIRSQAAILANTSSSSSSANYYPKTATIKPPVFVNYTPPTNDDLLALVDSLDQMHILK